MSFKCLVFCAIIALAAAADQSLAKGKCSNDRDCYNNGNDWDDGDYFCCGNENGKLGHCCDDLDESDVGEWIEENVTAFVFIILGIIVLAIGVPVLLCCFCSCCICSIANRKSKGKTVNQVVVVVPTASSGHHPVDSSKYQNQGYPNAPDVSVYISQPAPQHQHQQQQHHNLAMDLPPAYATATGSNPPNVVIANTYSTYSVDHVHEKQQQQKH